MLSMTNCNLLAPLKSVQTGVYVTLFMQTQYYAKVYLSQGTDHLLTRLLNISLKA